MDFINCIYNNETAILCVNPANEINSFTDFYTEGKKFVRFLFFEVMLNFFLLFLQLKNTSNWTKNLSLLTNPLDWKSMSPYFFLISINMEAVWFSKSNL